jgi:splicing factor 3A subunit 3
MGQENMNSIVGSEGSIHDGELQNNTALTASEKQPNVERDTLSKAASLLETNRCLSTEHEAALQFAASLLSNPAGLPNQNTMDGTRRKDASSVVDSNVPPSVKDAWLALLQNSELDRVDKESKTKAATNSTESGFEYPLPKGQLAKSAKVIALSTALRRSAEVAQLLLSKRKDDSLVCVQALKYAAGGKGESTVKNQEWFLQEFLERVKDIREYHAKHPSDKLTKEETDLSNQYSIYDMIEDGNGVESGIKHHSKKRKLGNAVADGYDLYSILQAPLHKIKSGQMFSAEEVMGKYLDLHTCHQSFLDLSFSAMEKENEKEKISYSDFVTYLASGLHNSKLLGERDKLAQRKKYVRFLNQLHSYLVDFLQRVSPLLDLHKEVVLPSLQDFETEWGMKGGVEGWENKSEEKVLAKSKIPGSEYQEDSISSFIDLNEFQSVEELVDNAPAEKIKVALARLGMKCGGTTLERAKRLWCTKHTPIDKLPAKLFTNKKGKGNKIDVDNSDSIELYQQSTNLRRVDIARLEFIVGALLDQLRPTLDATARRAERRLTQTVNEKEREMEEEISGEYDDGGGETGKDQGGDSDDSDDDDAPIYNPKGVPLGWDGKPIPYWLFKLHGLNHFYPCEICGNESYRGRHNFEKHFAEAKHSYGMKCLGIPNTNHFHGVTKIEDAQNLWLKLQENVNKDIFDASKEEEYEDSHGNVLSRSTYEDLARQGLL